MRALISASLVLALLAVVQASAAEWQAQERVEHYAVSGQTGAELYGAIGVVAFMVLAYGLFGVLACLALAQWMEAT